MKSILQSPALYQAFQEAGGFFGARVKAIKDYLTLRPQMRIIDIGCGPGYIVRHLPDGIDYIGFDIDQSYIGHAKKKFGNRGKFFCRYFDAGAAKEFAGADLVMMNGVLHHISDAELEATLTNLRDVLKDDGLLFTLDGCYRSGQSRFAKWMLDNDRGQYVRYESGYRTILSRVFRNVELAIREDYAHVPYTFVIGLAANDSRAIPRR
jgi:SAM-dependent methyltransferase